MMNRLFVLADIDMFSGNSSKDPSQMVTYFVKAICFYLVIVLARENPYLVKMIKSMERTFAVQHQKSQLVEVMYHIQGQLHYCE